MSVNFVLEIKIVMMIKTCMCRAKEQLERGICRVTDWGDFVDNLERKKLLLAPFCGAVACEEDIKKDSKK